MKKDKILHMRISEAEKERLEKDAAAFGASVSKYVRATLFKTEQASVPPVSSGN